MRSSTSSRIPHLARAIIEKRQAQFTSGRLHQKTSCYNSPSVNSLQNARVYSSSAQRWRRQDSILNGDEPRNSHISRRQPFTRPPPEQRPSRSPYDFDLPLEDGRYDPDKDPVRLARYRRAKIGFVFVVAGFIAYAYQSYQNDLKRYRAKGNVLAQDADVSSRWKDTARDFDREVDAAERFMLLKWKRKRLVREAYGDVLEVSVGTGRNMNLYDTKPYSPTESASFGRDTRHMITSLTFNDASPVMIENAKKKWSEEQKKRRMTDRFTGQVNWYVGDAGEENVIPRPAGGYDTIVQSWGICSMADPVKFLRHLSRLARQPGEKIVNSSPAKLRAQEEEDGKGGRIFLLEHGRGKYEWLNNFLDQSAPMHADRYGCWYNKDIDKVIQESGLVVERVRRYNFGTTYEYILRPAPGLFPGEDAMTTAQPNLKDNKQTAGWLSSLWR